MMMTSNGLALASADDLASTILGTDERFSNPCTHDDGLDRTPSGSLGCVYENGDHLRVSPASLGLSS